MTCYATWYGGSSYVWGDVEASLERFNSLKQVTDAFIERYVSNGLRKVRFPYVNREAESSFTPAVDLTAEMWVFFGEPNYGDPYPDAVIKFDPNNPDRVLVQKG